MELSEQYRLVAKEWVDADSAANMLEECKTATLSQKMVALGDIPVSRAEMVVKASPEWMDYLKAMVKAREKANYLKVKLEHIRMSRYERMGERAHERAEMRL